MTLPQKGTRGLILADRYRLGDTRQRTDAGLLFQGEDVALRREVAVEVASGIQDAQAQRTWLREARIAQQLGSEHVLRILDVGESRGVPFVVREASVRTLADELRRRGAIPIPKAVGWTLDACEAIAEAHAKGITHGDVRLENIHLAGAAPASTVKVAWRRAAKAERAAREDVARDVAGLGTVLRVLVAGRATEDGDDLAPTLPDGLAHAVELPSLAPSPPSVPSTARA